MNYFPAEKSKTSKNDSNDINPIPDIRKVKPGKRRPPVYGIITSLAIALALFTAWLFVSTYQPKGEQVGLGQIVREINNREYESIILKDDYVILEFGGSKRNHATISSRTDFYSVLAESGIPAKELKDDIYEPNVGISVGDIISLALLGAGMVLVYMMIRSMQASGGKLMDFGQSKAKLIFGRKTGVTFNDVAGIDEVKEELVEVVDFLKNPSKYMKIGARIPRGVLLVGPPGTGKTLLAKAVAGEAGVPFFHTSGSEFEEMLVGAGASRVRDLFGKAKKAAPCIIFIDEIDAVAKKRGTVLYGGGSEQTLNQILVEMDGLEQRENVIVLAATNRPDVLDPAVLRPGRFDRSVTVHMPDKKGRVEIMKVHAVGKKFEDNVDFDIVASKTVGYSGADLENLLNEAAIMAVSNGRDKVSQNDLLESYLKVKLGRQKKGKNMDQDLKRIAYHEAGHAVTSMLVEGSDPVERISIISRGSTGGVTVYAPEDERSLHKKSNLYARLVMGIGGKVAEEVFMGEMTTGASGDIRMTTEIARAMIQTYGMNDKLGFVMYGSPEDSGAMGYHYGSKEYSEDTAKQIDDEVRSLMTKAQDEAREILSSNKEIVEKLVEMLMEKEEVGREDFEGLFKK
jgi:cell division protease FtsH